MYYSYFFKSLKDETPLVFSILGPGKCPPSEAADDCPDDLGVYSGSTTIVDGMPYYAYPGVHLWDYNGERSALGC